MDSAGDLDLQHWLTTSSVTPSTQDEATEATADKSVWVLELYALANRGPFVSTPPAITIDSNIIQEIIHIFCSADSSLPSPALSPHLNNHPCRVFTAFLRSLIYEAGAPGWGGLVAEMSHLVYQRLKSQPMGSPVSDTIFNGARDDAMMRLGQSPFNPEPGKFFVSTIYRPD